MSQLSLDQTERYCVFRCDDRWYAIQALAVRSIVPRPELTPAPQSDPILKGICHTQNEFLPVISLRALTQIQYETAAGSEQQLLILSGPQGPWGLLIDQADSLATLEIAISNYANSADRWAQATLGSASYRNQVLEVLDPVAVYEYAAGLIDGYWLHGGQHELRFSH